MLTLYWFCLGGGLVFTILMVLLDGLLDGALDALDGAFDAIDLGGALDPLSGIAGVTVFGGAGLLLDAYTGLATTPQVIVAALIGLVSAIVLHTVYVKPMKQSENSTAFSVQEYAGKTGEAGTTIPASGFGEVQVRMGASTTFQTAQSFSGVEIPDGTPIVVVEVAPDGVLRVAPLSADEHTPAPARAPARLRA